MSCNDCTSCTSVTTNVPECYSNGIDVGNIGSNGTSVDVEIIKLSNDYRVEASFTSGGSGDLTITLSSFTDVDATFWRKDGGGYKITVYDANDRNTTYTLTDDDTTTATCLLLNFTRGSTDFENNIILQYAT